jgi:light-regulated signal transduction histidine kinase (bacteriophytochrome)
LRQQPVDLSALAAEIMAALAKEAPQRRVTVRIEPGLHTEADPELLRVLLENLLGNAWKFTARAADAPAAQIEFGKSTQAGERVYYVGDNGVGFDMAYADKLFSPFQRLHRVTEFAGFGIGLATVQRIVHRHGGRIWVSAVEGQGATFFFTLDEFSADELSVDEAAIERGD